MNTADVPDRLLLDCRLDSGVAVVEVTGEVDVSTSSSLRNSLLRVITGENHHGLVVNLASVTTAGEDLTLVERDDPSGWAWVRNAAGQEGWVPLRTVAPMSGA